MRETRLSGSVEGVVGDHDSYSDCLFEAFTIGGKVEHLFVWFIVQVNLALPPYR